MHCAIILEILCLDQCNIDFFLTVETLKFLWCIVHIMILRLWSLSEILTV